MSAWMSYTELKGKELVSNQAIEGLVFMFYEYEIVDGHSNVHIMKIDDVNIQ